MKKLIIVESPTKANTIKNYVGNDYEVIASVGHIRDLATSGKGGYGVDVDGNFEPNYRIIRGKNKVVNDIKKAAKGKEILIATDPDREGEAIAWHLADILGLDENGNNRIRFYEITKKAITEALENPEKIDMNLVLSQETRRTLDRIIGFDLSKLVQRKLRSNSAGRVQSVALRMIYERELERDAFVEEAYYLVFADINDFKAAYVKNSVKQKDEEYAKEVVLKSGKEFSVSNIDVKEQNRFPGYPYTTSRLQQDGIRRLRMSASFVMGTAQKLYEGVKIGDETVGLITYMRTDSTKLSPGFVKETKAFIAQNYGKEYVGFVRKSKASKSSQEAHEAVRPTDINLTPEKVKPYLDNNGYRLYRMIYNNTLASLMKKGIDEIKKVTFDANGYLYENTFTRPLFLGYRILFRDEEEIEETSFSHQEGDILISENVYYEEKFTQPPRRYSEATLIGEMEKVGVGRPSTYSDTTRKIIDVGYAFREKGYFVPSDQGKLTAKNLIEYFDNLINTDYTSKMEEQLDMISLGEDKKEEVLKEFYETFRPLVDEAHEKMPDQRKKREVVLVGENCPECGKPLVYRYNMKNEKFIACTGFLDKPRCTYTRSIEDEKDKPKKQAKAKKKAKTKKQGN